MLFPGIFKKFKDLFDNFIITNWFLFWKVYFYGYVFKFL